MDNKKINIREKFKFFSEHWSPKVIAELNDYQFKIAKIKGRFIWHSHDETDEVFIVIKGKMQLEFRKGMIELGEGEMYVVPKGIDHRPFAHEECEIMLIEPKGVVNTGEVVNDLTRDNDVWI
ncbi:MAG: cupin domain-containing protein [Candidatus Neomarinimicrobiota bacterium]